MKRALLIGINYLGSPNQLNGCVDDISNISNFLQQKCNYQSSNITELVNNNATHNNIIVSFQNLITNSKPGDSIFFYYSGHGAVVSGSVSQEKSETDDAIIPNDYLTGGFITDDYIYSNFLMHIPANVTLWGFTDCCHSGTMFDLKYNWVYTPVCNVPITLGMQYIDSQWDNNFNVNILKSNETVGDIFLISGCADTQTSADAFENGQAQGAFSFCFLQCIQNTPNFQQISIAELYKQIVCLEVIYGFSQRSQLNIGKQSDFNINCTF